jgi:hypothetical protein
MNETFHACNAQGDILHDEKLRLSGGILHRPYVYVDITEQPGVCRSTASMRLPAAAIPQLIQWLQLWMAGNDHA